MTKFDTTMLFAVADCSNGIVRTIRVEGMSRP